jgi:6-phospho-beta-glucosidase
MRITILGAAGMRTPLLLQGLLARQARLEIESLALMAIDGEHLELLGRVTADLELRSARFPILRTTDASEALRGADVVLTTFRVGGPASRVIDERVPLEHGVLGQETTGAGGFAMAMRTIPVLFDYLEQMGRLCPEAWLVNFANPSGLLTEAATRQAGWRRAVGICDAPIQMQRIAAQRLGVAEKDVELDYFGLNHLGWVRRVMVQGVDRLPGILQAVRQGARLPGMPIAPEILLGLGLVPNEYLYYYYHSREAVAHLLHAGRTRGQVIAALTDELFEVLRNAPRDESPAAIRSAYAQLLFGRGASYMVLETGEAQTDAGPQAQSSTRLPLEGYAAVALDLIEALRSSEPRRMILNIPNQSAIPGMGAEEVVEIPALVSSAGIVALPVEPPPEHALGLMKLVKAYERMTIEAAREGSYNKALLALAIHPLVADVATARRILDRFIVAHGALFPRLSKDERAVNTSAGRA